MEDIVINPILLAALVVVKELLEYWLGKTDKVPAGSTLEAVLMFIVKMLESIGVKQKTLK